MTYFERNALVVLTVAAAFLLGSLPRSGAAASKPLEAAIYFVVADKAFERAAKTAAPESDKSTDKLLIGVTTKEDFFNAWKAIAAAAKDKKTKVQTVHLFTHASKGDAQDGLEFTGGAAGGTLPRDEIEALPQLTWTTDGAVILYGCNTGHKGDRDWCPAESFAKSQKVAAIGEMGYAYFSSESKQYKEITEVDKHIFLRAYKRGKNIAIPPDGSRIPTKAYKP